MGRRGTRTAALVCCLLLTVAAQARAQNAPRRLTIIEALRQYPGYYHLQNVVLRGEFAESVGRITLRSDAGEIRVRLSEGVKTTSGHVEVRGQLIDVGRLEVGDSRVTALGEGVDTERWPRPGEELFLSVTGITEAAPAATATVRSIALEPWKFEGRPVTVTGNFRGRNLFGDQPGAPGQGRWDFVLRGTEGAIWVSGQQPKGRGFDLDVMRRLDSNQWLEVTGTVSRQRGLVIIEATKLTLAKPLTSTVEAGDPPAPAPPPPPAGVIFSSPSDGETDVNPAGAVRVQFSRGLTPATVATGFRVSYVGAGPTDPGLDARVTYDPGNRSVELAFTEPLQRFRTVKVDTLDSLRALDGGLVTPWSMTFSSSN